MTVDIPETIELAEQRAELKTVLESKGSPAPRPWRTFSRTCARRCSPGRPTRSRSTRLPSKSFIAGPSSIRIRIPSSALRPIAFAGAWPSTTRAKAPETRCTSRFRWDNTSQNSSAIRHGRRRTSSMDPGKPSPGIGVAPRQRVFAPLLRHGWWAALSLLVLLLAGGYVWHRSLQQKQGRPAVDANPFAGLSFGTFAWAAGRRRGAHSGRRQPKLRRPRRQAMERGRLFHRRHARSKAPSTHRAHTRSGLLSHQPARTVPLRHSLTQRHLRTAPALR